jgi:hypothetical protein
MTKKTRYFVLAAGAVLVVGLGGGLVAYLAYNRIAGVPAGLPPEVRYVPVDAEVVAFANVRAIMSSELRRALMPSIDPESRKGHQMMNDFAGVDLEKQVDHVVMYVEPFIRQKEGQPAAPKPNGVGGRDIPRASLLVHGSFDQTRIEQFIRERGGAAEEHLGQKMFVHREGPEQIAVGFIQPDVIGIGQADLVRRAIDVSRSQAREFNDITTNTEMMNLIRDTSGSTAWVVGQFDEISRRMKLPTAVTGQVPPVRLVSVKADINGGVKAAIRAEAGDKAAADQLRDVVRGFVSLARLQASDKEEFSNVLKSVELSGTDTTVRVSFAVSPDTLRLVAPSPRRRREPPNAPIPPNPPQPGK